MKTFLSNVSRSNGTGTFPFKAYFRYDKFHHIWNGTSSVPVPLKLELVPELGNFSSVTQHHCHHRTPVCSFLASRLFIWEEWPFFLILFILRKVALFWHSRTRSKTLARLFSQLTVYASLDVLGNDFSRCWIQLFTFHHFL